MVFIKVTIAIPYDQLDVEADVQIQAKPADNPQVTGYLLEQSRDSGCRRRADCGEGSSSDDGWIDAGPADDFSMSGSPPAGDVFSNNHRRGDESTPSSSSTRRRFGSTPDITALRIDVHIKVNFHDAVFTRVSTRDDYWPDRDRVGEIHHKFKIWGWGMWMCQRFPKISLYIAHTRQ